MSAKITQAELELKINLLTQQLAERDAQYLELQQQYELALEDIRRLMEQQAQAQTTVVDESATPWEQIVTKLGLNTTNEAWKHINCQYVEGHYRVWFASEYYRTNRHICVPLLRKLTNQAIGKGFNATPRSTYLAISSKT